MTDRELLDRKGHEVNDDLPPLPSAELDALLDHIYEYGTNAEGVIRRARALCDAYARAAVLAERERCAKVCEAEAESLGSGGKRDAAALCCASAIRAGTTIRKGE
jgi:hypothetical protein